MVPLIILIGSFLLVQILNTYVLRKTLSISFIGKVSLAVMLVFTGTAHFYKTDAMIESMPDFMPAKAVWVYLTGVLELLSAVGLLIHRTARLTSIALILFFICVLPANIVGSLKHVELGGMENGPVYLFFRIPLQFFFIGWTYYFGIRKVAVAKAVAVSK